MSSPSPGLGSAAQIEALADQMSLAADAIHKRVMNDIGSHNGGPVSEQDQAIARALLEDEILLRQRANGLYAEAASYVVQALAVSQQALIQLTMDATEKIRKIDRIAAVAGLAGALLRLAGAVATANPVPIVAAIERLSTQVKVVKATE
ncbi:hypothetical protein [Massilia sp. CF038]|uniref:hypothetical protein n=1 Tax=Massilia sp. CF038 TaxID=1881045 RepID=UPI00091AC756|nr:hypothetical protein [Massilia sp. CF038]SHH07131.1 hypothetical protein SAMN05428948_2626 [Massilia sp. CF038]